MFLFRRKAIANFYCWMGLRIVSSSNVWQWRFSFVPIGLLFVLQDLTRCNFSFSGLSFSVNKSVCDKFRMLFVNENFEIKKREFSIQKNETFEIKN